MERDDDGNEELVNASFLRHQFDEHTAYGIKMKRINACEGRWKQFRQSGKGAYMEELTRMEHIDPFRWKPTAELVERLLRAIRTKKKHI